MTAAAASDVKFVPETPTVSARFVTGSHFQNGIGLELEISIELSVEKDSDKLKIDLNAAFEQEISLSVDVNIEDDIESSCCPWYPPRDSSIPSMSWKWSWK